MGRRLLAGLLGLATAVPLLALAGAPPALAADAPSVVARGGAAGADYATDVFGDPWDYGNEDDLLLDGNGPTLALRDQRMVNGLVRAEVSGAGYVSPVWSGYEGALLLGRDGSADGKAIDADRYRAVSFSAWASRDVNAGLMWFACPGGGVSDQCGGGHPFTLKEGWHTYVIRPTTSAYASGSAWTRRYQGQLTGLRLSLSPGGTAGFALDWMRLSQPDSGQQVRWQNPSPGTAAELIWDRNGDRSDNVPGQPGWGVVDSTSAASATADLSVLPADDYRLLVRSRGSWGDELRATLDAPIAVLTNPDEDGDRDFATDVLRDPWDMAGPSDVDRIWHSTDIDYANGRLAATNDLRSALPNDPHVYLRTGPGIDSRTYSRLTLTTGYDGPFDLRDVAGGGTMGRITWRRADLGDTVMQTKDILTYTGRRTVTIDMDQPAMDLTDEATTARHAFVSGSPVTQFRWDPNEDRGARRWYVHDISLKSEFVAHRGFPVRWYDAAWRPGGTAAVYADTDRRGCDGRRIASGQPVQRGGNSTPWEVDGTPAGRYWLCVKITRGAAVTEQYAKAPVLVSGFVIGSAPAAPAVPEVASAAGGAVVHWSPPASPGSPIAGYQVRDTFNGQVRTVGELDPGIAWTGLSASRDAAFQVRALNDAGWGDWSTASAPVRPAVPQASRFVPREPVRVLAARVSAGAPVTLPLRGVAGVPAAASAVALNVTSTRAAGDGALSVYPTGSASGTSTSSLNVKEGTDRPNAVTAKLSASGSVTLSINAGASDVLVDLFGWYVPSGGLGFHPVPPVRLLDTRDGTGVRAGVLGARGTALLGVTGGAVPSGARAVVLNTTAAGVVGGGFVSVYPPGQPDGRTTSALNTRTGVDVANLVTTALDPYGQVQLYNDAGSAHLVGDLAGWYDAAPDGLALTPVSPWRVLDTRTGLGAPPGKIAGGQTRVLDLAGDVPSGVPSGARAVVLNLTATEVEAPGTYLSVYPTGAAGGPSTSSLNLPGGDTRPNLVVAMLAADGSVEVYDSSGAAHVIADVVGYFA